MAPCIREGYVPLIWPRGCSNENCSSTTFLYFLVLFKLAMSFGFGVGDIIAVANLANKIRQRFVDSPEQFKAIATE